MIRWIVSVTASAMIFLLPTDAVEGMPGARVLAAQSASSSGGDSGWFPATRLFPTPMAAPGEPGFRGAAVSTDLFRGGAPNSGRPTPDIPDLRDGGRDFQGIVSLGESYPLRRFRFGELLAQVGIQVGVNARFRLATASNEYVASDWIVGLPIEFLRSPVIGRMLVFHRSAHLGDEIIEEAGIRRMGFGHEGFALLVGTAAGPFRVYGGGTRILRSETSGTLIELGLPDRDGWEAQLGMEWEQGVPEDASPFAGFVAVDLRTSERTDWKAGWSALAGVAVRMRGRSGRIALRWLDGPSMHGEFFLIPESAWGIEMMLTR